MQKPQKSASDARDTEQIEAHGLKALRLRGSGCEALVYLHGAHVASFRAPQHGELLWLSERAVYAAGKAIRGGIPLCFPWFGAHPLHGELPAHGFARTRSFQLEGWQALGDGVVAELSLTSDAQTRAAFPHAFRARLRVSVGVDGPRLGVAFEVESSDAAGFDYELALHTYLRVADVRSVRVHGLSGASYDDKVSGARGVVEGEAPLVFEGETDRVYTSSSRLSVEDPVLKRRIVVDKRGSHTTVVWNPWLAKAQRMADFGDDEWPGMLCIEAANAGPDRVTLAPGARHVTETTIFAEAT
jgi:glucose-6-phosphate 1-epimerase